MSNKKSGSSTATIIATAVVGLAAAAAVVFLIVLVMGGGKNNESESVPVSSAPVAFQPSRELIDECNNNAHDLLAGNYEILRLFRLEGLPHEDEPYGNAPEDGYYTAVSDKFASYAALESYVRSIFVSDEADRILTDFDGKIVYKTREDNGALGIIADFAPDETYNKPWESTRIQFVPQSETECSLKIFLGADEETDLTAVPAELTLDALMIKGDEGWRLTRLVY